MSMQAYALTVKMLETYKQMRQIRSTFLSKKYRPLHLSYPKYKLFDFEHPYQEMEEETKNALNSFERMLKIMLDLAIDESSIRNELDKMTTMLILSDKNDANIERLRKL